MTLYIQIVMIIKYIRHKGLRNFYETGDRSGIPANLAGRLMIMMTVLQTVASEKAIEKLPSWQPHRLKGELKGY